MKDIIGFFKYIILACLSGFFAFAGYIAYRAYEDGRLFAPPPPPTPEELATAAFNAKVWTIVWIALWGLFIAGVALAIVRFLYVPALNNRERIPYDPVTGLAPVIRRNVAPWWMRITGHNEYDEFDANLATAPHRKISSNGTLRVMAEADGLDPHSQAEYARGSWGVQGSVARKGRGISVGESRLLSGEASARAETQRLNLERARRKLGDLPALPEPVAPPPAPVTFQEAVTQSTPTSWVLGQGADKQPANPDRVGQLLTFDPRSSHMALIGATRTGKTSSTGLMVVMLARRHGIHPIVLDGKDGFDWAPLDRVVEWHSMTDVNLPGYLVALRGIYQERAAILKATGKGHIYELPPEQRPVPILVIFEEFGEHFSALSSAARKAAGRDMNSLFRLCQAAGITLCLIDQAPENWTQQMRGNSKFVICYKLKGGVANSFSEYYADQLPDRGVYSQDNSFYKAWHTKTEAADLAGMFPPLATRLLPVLDAETPTNDDVPTNEPETPTNRPVQVVRTNERPETKGGDNGKKVMIPPSLQRSFVRSGSWADFCQGLFVAYPTLTQAQLRRAMVEVEGTGKGPEQFKGVAFEMYHRYSPKGDRSKFA